MPGVTTTCDCLTFLLDAGEVTNLFYRGAGTHRNVSGKYNNSDQVVGLQICRRGALTNSQQCGNITHANAQYTDASGTLVQHQYCMNNLVRTGGDSGAPVYRVQTDESIWAAGFHKGIYDVDNNGTNETCHSTINSALNKFSSTLFTG